MRGVIRGTGSCLPERIVDNNDLARIMDTNDEWIRERTGIARRRIAGTETTVDMAARAAQRALENAGVDAMDIDVILVSTVSSDTLLPSTACMVQQCIGAKKAFCFDLNAACTGFLFALNTAQAYFHAGMAEKILIIGVESLSNLVDWKDRGTAILFGDGAGAAVLVREEGELPGMVMHSDGNRAGALTCRNRFEREKITGTCTQCTEGEGQDCRIAGYPADSYIRMNGQEVFRFAVKQVPECIEELLQKCGRKKEEIDFFILHQANRRIMESIAKRLKTDIAHFPMNLQELGNTSSASIPILLDELNRKEILKKGMKLVLAGFGAGLSWGAVCMEWEK